MSHILLLTHHFPSPEEPGAGRPWAEATMLRDLGHDVTVLTAGTHYLTGERTRRGKGPWSVERRDGLRVVKTYALANHRTSLLRRAVNYLAYTAIALIAGLRRRYDIVFVGTDPVSIVPIAYLLAAIRRARLVLDERDLTPDTQIALGLMKRGLLARAIDGFMRWVRARAFHIVAATPGIAALLRERGVPSTRLTVMQNAFPWDLPVPGDADDGSGEFVVFFGGGMGLASELLTVVKAAEELAASEVPARFVFVGEGDRREEYLEYCRRRGVSNCEFRPLVARADLAPLLAAADVCVHSLPADPFWRCALSSKVAEYMAYGKPVVFAGEGDMADLLKESGGGISVPPENPEALAKALRQLFEQPEFRDEMGERGRSYVLTEFSPGAQRDRLARALRC